ncbi:hypothetical protein [Endozoicomonas sp. 8E]|uniref:hypothetical protein n=1 Tax=Endozoicomonas sp. 8E TaxID=3035692 RepID=UPI0029392C58|nr:hypothetical protein [Endozoicomonas sp. 8E]WOG29554.1 hypothetical protein P6910_07860 [Endozoicomonas sp. 8E]
MTNARPNALSLAVAIAISSSIISTQAQAERKLQTKSLDISYNGHMSFTQSLVRVQPTLAGDQQPIPKSFTTTYPDQTQAREGYMVPSEGFTDILSAVSADVSSVDLFETDENDIAQKYTKVLKVGDEDVFRFTHSLEETKLVIEVRSGMTDQDTVDAVRDQLTCISSLEPSTKLARPEQLYAVLLGADNRAGNLGTSDHYVALATIKVEPVEVNGRTFMRLIASGDQPPELKRLGQSLFVNDETLLAAATSAYIQVHVLKEELQQEALDRLLALSKPVGYVVHEEDCTKVYPAPSGYPKLVPGHTQEDTIVFYSQKLNPADIAFVENLYSLLAEAEPDGLTHTTTKVKKYRVKSYQHVIQSRQWALLEELAARSDAGFSRDKLTSLAYYEALQQALASATPHRANEFELTLEQLKAASSVLTPTWMHYQLVKYFSFCSAIKTLLTDQRFIQNMEELIPVIRDIHKVQANGDEELVARVVKGMSLQMIDTYDKIEALRKKEGEYIRLIKHLELTAEKEKEKLRALELKHQAEHELAQTRQALEELQNQSQKLVQAVERMPALEQQVRDAIEKATKIRNTELAEELGIGNWDDTRPPEEQASRIRERINKIFTAVAVTGQPEEDTVRTNLAAIEGQLGIVPDNENDLDARFQSLQQHLQQQEKLTDKALWNRLANIEGQHRQKHLLHLQKLEKQKNWLQEVKQKVDLIPVLRDELRDPLIETIENYNDQLADTLGIDYWIETAPTMAEQATIISKEIHEISKSGQLPQEALKVILASIENKHDITPNNEIDLAARFQSIQQHLQQELQQKTELIDDLIRNRLANFEDQLGLPDNDYHLEYRRYALQQHLKQRIEQVGQEHLRQLGIRTEAEKIAATKARFATIAAHLNIQDFDSDEDIDVQQERLLEKIKTMDAQQKILFQRVETLSDQQDTENSYTRARRGALAAVPGIELSEDNTPEDRKTLESTVNLKLFRLAELEEELKDSGTQGHQKAKPEVLETISAIEEALEMFDVDENDGVYLRREDISDKMQEFITQASEIQTDYLAAIEKRLKIYPHENSAAEARSMVFTARLARDLQVEFEDDATIDDQVRQLNAKLRPLDDEAFSVGEPDVQERIAAIEDELDRQMARLGPKPRYVLDRELATAKRALREAENELTDVHGKLDTLLGKELISERNPDDLQHRPNEENRVANQAMQLIQEQARLKGEIETRQADVERMKEDLRAAKKAVENDGGPFQYSPRQKNILCIMRRILQQCPLKKQGLEAAMGLAELAVKNGKEIPRLTTLDFDDEFAPIRLQALIGDGLSFDQSTRMVAIFKSLKTSFPVLYIEFLEITVTALDDVQELVCKLRNEIEKGAQEYDEEIHDLSSSGIHPIEHQPGDLRSFSEYFATRSASGNKIMVLLREGLISKIELENYIKAARGVDGYQTVAEFEHFLGHRHGVKVPHFKSVVQMLSDEGVEEFIKSAFTPVTVTGPAGMKESVDSMKEYAMAVIANYVLDDIAFENGRRTAAFLTNAQETLTPYAHAAGLSESELIQAVHDTLMQAHAAAVERQLSDYWVKPSAFLVQAVTWYYSSYKPLLMTHTTRQAAELSLSNMAFLYLLDLTNRGDYLHRMPTPFQHWLERYGIDPDRTGQYHYHNGIEQVSEVGGLAMPLGKAASSVILLGTGSTLFARQYNANPQRYRSISRLVPEIVKSMGSGQGVQVPLMHRVTPHKVKTLASATAALVLGPVATVGAYAHGLISGFTYAQTFGFALASSLTFDFFMNNNKMLTQWLGGPLGRSLDKFNRWRGVGESHDEYVKRTAIATPQYFSETDKEYAYRAKANNTLYGWTRHENYLQFRERRDRTMRLFENGWEKYFRENVPKWSFSHAESIPYSCTLGAFFGSGTAAPGQPSATVKAAPVGLEVEKFDLEKDKNTRDEL